MMAGGTLVRRAAEEAVGDGVANELSPPPQAKLLHDVRPVRFDRVDADVQLVGDLLAGVPQRHQAQHLGLSSGQLRTTLRSIWSRRPLQV